MKEDWIYKRGDLYYANLNPLLTSLKNVFRTLLTKKVFGHCAKWFKRRKPLTK